MDCTHTIVDVALSEKLFLNAVYLVQCKCLFILNKYTGDSPPKHRFLVSKPRPSPESRDTEYCWLTQARWVGNHITDDSCRWAITVMKANQGSPIRRKERGRELMSKGKQNFPPKYMPFWDKGHLVLIIYERM